MYHEFTNWIFWIWKFPHSCTFFCVQIERGNVLFKGFDSQSIPMIRVSTNKIRLLHSKSDFVTGTKLNFKETKSFLFLFASSFDTMKARIALAAQQFCRICRSTIVSVKINSRLMSMNNDNRYNKFIPSKVLMTSLCRNRWMNRLHHNIQENRQQLLDRRKPVRLWSDVFKVHHIKRKFLNKQTKHKNKKVWSY